MNVSAVFTGFPFFTALLKFLINRFSYFSTKSYTYFLESGFIIVSRSVSAVAYTALVLYSLGVCEAASSTFTNSVSSLYCFSTCRQSSSVFSTEVSSAVMSACPILSLPSFIVLPNRLYHSRVVLIAFISSKWRSVE